ncbi:hypothetical protein BFW01_g4549 [Lasiodiplodia theobromae]|nr:hypothetical protein BFW01_g4549 [Lasiodiplodia theobromae]
MDPTEAVPLALLARRARLKEESLALMRDAEKKLQELDNLEKESEKLNEQIKREGAANRQKKRKYDQYLAEECLPGGAKTSAYPQSQLVSAVCSMKETMKENKDRLDCYELLKTDVEELIAEAYEHKGPIPVHLFTEEQLDMLACLESRIQADRKQQNTSVVPELQRISKSIQMMKKSMRDQE